MVDKIGESFQAQMQSFGNQDQAKKASESEQSNFETMLKSTLQETNQKSLKAGQMAEGLAAGEHRKIHETMIAQQEASLSSKMVRETRNKVVEAYQKVFRMPV